MKVWYCTEQRFINRIKKRWKKNEFKYHAGHVQLMSYSFRVVLYWASVERQKVSEINRLKNNLKLF